MTSIEVKNIYVILKKEKYIVKKSIIQCPKEDISLTTHNYVNSKTKCIDNFSEKSPRRSMHESMKNKISVDHFHSKYSLYFVL